MAKLNKNTPVKTTTHNGGKGFKRTPQMELFIRATSSFAGENKYYEKAEDADARAIQLIRELAVTDWPWTAKFLPWLRQSANIRTMSIMLAVEAVHARLAAKRYGALFDTMSNRQLIDAVLQRPDEPGEMISYWLNTYGRAIPQPVKRGVADAVKRMVNERQALRWDKDGNAVRLGDVIELVHAKPRKYKVTSQVDDCSEVDKVQSELYKYLITDRHKRENYTTPVVLTAIRARDALNAMPPDDRHDFARKVKQGDVQANALWKQALAGQWEWGKSWLGVK
jgi:hypothetical protein